jgi:hypothetical protein
MQNFKLKLIDVIEPKTEAKKDEAFSILDPRFKYIPSSKTNIRATWKKHGWKPKEKL